MKKPEAWDSTEAATAGEQYKTLPPGNYVCRINSAFESISKSGKTQLNILFDIAEGEHKGFYQAQYDSKAAKDINANWPGAYRQLTEGNSLKFFKGMVTAIEESNNFVWDFDEAKLKGKLFMGQFGIEEYQRNDGKIGSICKLRWIRSTKSNAKLPILEPKKLSSKPSAMDGFAPQDDIPGF